MGLFDFLNSNQSRWNDFQRLLVPDAKMQVPRKELLKIADMEVKQSRRILIDSLRIIQKTKNPDTFNHRVELAEMHLDRLLQIENCHCVNFNKEARPSMLYKQFQEEKEKLRAEMEQRAKEGKRKT